MAVIIVLAFLRVNLGFTMLLGAAILGFLLLSPSDAALSMVCYAVEFKALDLAASVALIALLGSLLKATGQMRSLVDALKEAGVGSRPLMAFIPAILGTLPMPGGALLSAPMVEEEGRKSGVPPREGAYINLWFRHVVFLIYPFTPALILLSELVGIDLEYIVPHLIAPFLAMVAVGYLLSLRGVRGVVGAKNLNWMTAKRILLGLLPLAVVPVLDLALDVPHTIPVVVGVVLALLLSRPTASELVKVVRDAKLPNFTLSMIGIMVFRGIMIKTGVSQAVYQALQGLALPLPLLITLLSFLIGFSTGYPSASIVILASLLPSLTSMGLIMGLYTASVIGYVISPLHLCLVVTSEYFSVSFRDMYPKLILSAAATLLTTLLLIPVYSLT